MSVKEELSVFRRTFLSFCAKAKLNPPLVCFCSLDLLLNIVSKFSPSLCVCAGENRLLLLNPIAINIEKMLHWLKQFFWYSYSAVAEQTNCALCVYICTRQFWCKQSKKNVPRNPPGQGNRSTQRSKNPWEVNSHLITPDLQLKVSSQTFPCLLRTIYIYWSSVQRSRWMGMGKVQFCMFMAREGPLVHKRGQHSAFSCRTQWIVPTGQDSAISPARVANHSEEFASFCSLIELAI